MTAVRLIDDGAIGPLHLGFVCNMLADISRVCENKDKTEMTSFNSGQDGEVSEIVSEYLAEQINNDLSDTNWFFDSNGWLAWQTPNDNLNQGENILKGDELSIHRKAKTEKRKTTRKAKA